MRGTIVHWAVWYRHWDLLDTICKLYGGSVVEENVVNGVELMEGSPLVFANRLEEQMGHDCYNHFGCCRHALLTVSKENRSTLNPEKIVLCSETDFESSEIKILLCGIVEYNNIEALDEVLKYLTPNQLANLQVHVDPYHDPFGNTGTLGHYCVWYRHWDFLNKLVELGAYDPSAKGYGGGWMNNHTMLSYAQFLQGENGVNYELHDLAVRGVEAGKSNSSK
eukprot:TRINITY_DN5894_c1_g2_i1.p1 TRINITY_DN5894_c1_g2~~TRINITY_DN5894_c1_g2_i1.p1  ORF type:complete len:222 (-),score=34.76 TRINITY_DN5894_c1_g2_i1:53-718(-)